MTLPIGTIQTLYFSHNEGSYYLQRHYSPDVNNWSKQQIEEMSAWIEANKEQFAQPLHAGTGKAPVLYEFVTQPATTTGLDLGILPILLIAFLILQ